ncbi:MAG: hypothetical protein WA939_01005 [Nodosilinea sp.]
MKRILSTGNAFTIATDAGDAGQLGMVAGFNGFLSDRISLLLHPIVGAALGNFSGSDPITNTLGKGGALRGDRHWGDLQMWFRSFLGLSGCLTKGDRPDGLDFDHRISRRSLYSFSQHFVSQH